MTCVAAYSAAASCILTEDTLERPEVTLEQLELGGEAAFPLFHAFEFVHSAQQYL